MNEPNEDETVYDRATALSDELVDLLTKSTGPHVELDPADESKANTRRYRKRSLDRHRTHVLLALSAHRIACALEDLSQAMDVDPGELAENIAKLEKGGR